MWINALQLSGSITALATPFAADGALDVGSLRRLIERQIAGGTQAIVIAGSTGEAAMLDDFEYERLLRSAVESVAGRVPVLAGCGLSGTERTLVQTRRAHDCGVQAALVVTPPYVRPTQDGLFAHYERVAAHGGLPVVLYNVPSRAAVDLLPETVARLASIPGIVGLKEALPDAARMEALLRMRPAGFSILSGDDPTALRAMATGADGVISVAANVVPRAFRQLCDLARPGAPAGARALDDRLRPLYDFLGLAPNPMPLKAILSQLSLCADVVRLPLLPLPAELRGSLRDLAAVANALEHDPLA